MLFVRVAFQLSACLVPPPIAHPARPVWSHAAGFVRGYSSSSSEVRNSRALRSVHLYPSFGAAEQSLLYFSLDSHAVPPSLASSHYWPSCRVVPSRSLTSTLAQSRVSRIQHLHPLTLGLLLPPNLLGQALPLPLPHSQEGRALQGRRLRLLLFASAAAGVDRGQGVGEVWR